ncbi:hypothetical protein OESDEN_12062, partial [Oesophagostomum dentatum]
MKPKTTQSHPKAQTTFLQRNSKLLTLLRSSMTNLLLRL